MSIIALKWNDANIREITLGKTTRVVERGWAEIGPRTLLLVQGQPSGQVVPTKGRSCGFYQDEISAYQENMTG